MSWQPPPNEQHNGIIREYVINITEIYSGNTFILVSVSLYANITSLHPNYYYQISVSAVTISAGPPSVFILLKTLEDG